MMLQSFWSLSPAAKEILKSSLEQDFRKFISFFFLVLNGVKFEWSDHHDEIIDALLECYAHRCSRLVINIPPRYSKTEIVVVMFIAWCIARDSRCQFIHLSSSDALVTDNSARVRELVLCDEFQAMWLVEFNADRNAKQLWRTKEGGGLRAASAGGQVRGFGAGVAYTEGDKEPEDTNPENVPFGGAIIIDDPLKDEEAESDIERAKVNRRLNSTIKSRCNAPWTPIIIIMQRLHDDDPTGFVLNGGTGEDWKHLNIPVLRKDGSPLWRFRHNEKELAAIRMADKFVWNAQYMQQPIPDEGEYFLAEHARWYTNVPEHLHYYGSSDYAASDSTGSDWTEHAIWGVDKDGNIYAVDWWSGQTKSDVWIEEQIDLASKYEPMMWFGEGGPIKASIEPWLTKRMKERRVYFPLSWQSHSHPNYKAWMARSFQGMWEAGRVYLPKDKEWGQEVLRQLTRFPRGTLDDKVDCCSLFGRGIARVWEPTEPSREDDRINIEARTGEFHMPGIFEDKTEKTW